MFICNPIKELIISEISSKLFLNILLNIFFYKNKNINKSKILCKKLTRKDLMIKNLKRHKKNLEKEGK